MFRAANEGIREAQRSLELPDGNMPFICECSDAACRQILLLTPAEYERVRSDASQFFVAPAHEIPGEVVRERNPAYWVVAKGEGV